MREFVIEKCPYEEDEILFKKSKITLETGVTVLVGCNGSGKSTFIESIKRRLDRLEIPFVSYDNLSEGSSTARSNAGWFGDMNLLATLMSSSEGEQIIANLGTVTRKIGRFVKDNRNKLNEIWIFLDAIDSGMSIDNILDIKEYLFKTILEDNKNKDVYIIVSANEYEMCNGENCFDVTSGKYRKFKTYNSYKNFIIKSKEYKDKRYSAD
jgi:predicted ATP-binding protein involved in virulence